jgi:hypothetical protein
MTMACYDMVTVEILSASFQTSQLGEGMLCYRLTESGRLLTPRGFDLAYHGLLHLIGEDGAEFRRSSPTGAWRLWTLSWSKVPRSTAASVAASSGRAIRGDPLLMHRAGGRQQERPARLSLSSPRRPHRRAHERRSPP